MGKILKDVKFIPRWVSFIGALFGAMKAAGEKRFTEDELYAFSGYAFRLNINPVVCPSGPTAFDWSEMVTETFDRIGYDYTVYESPEDSSLFKLRREQAHSAIKKSIDNKMPVIAWGLCLPEFGLITGYDDKKKLYHISSTLDYKETLTMPYSKLGKSDVRYLYVIVIGRKVPLKKQESIKKTIEAAVFHARGENIFMGGYESGFAGYDLWISSLKNKDADFFGNAYNAQFWAECRRNASAFLTGIARDKTNSKKSGIQFIETAARHFQLVAKKVTLMSELYTWPPQREELNKPGNRKESINLLKEALHNEKVAIEALEKYVKANK